MELQKELGHEFNFNDGKRRFVFEENINLIEADILIFCNTYFLNDVIVFLKIKKLSRNMYILAI